MAVIRGHLGWPLSGGWSLLGGSAIGGSTVLIGPLPLTEEGNKYILTMVDYFSKWPEAQALPRKCAQGIALFNYKTTCRYVFTNNCARICQ